ncbi:MAG: carbohydrate kinase [Gemmatimonadaceae bacterium]|nr:carbohydrate kinase [Chitinophagaceae bacterium]
MRAAIAIFDIGKTNKKLFVFDQHYNILIEKSTKIEEVVDEDGDPCEDLPALSKWVKAALLLVAGRKDIKLEALNFSTYGASFVHADRGGHPIAPLYNYLKPFPDNLKEKFYSRYGGEFNFAVQTASPVLGNLNSGLQLYYLKENKPALFDKINYSLHLPQYMSSLFSGRLYSDITSIGCHTGMWNFTQNRYHEWLSKEGIISKLAPIFPSDQLIAGSLNGKTLRCGVGLHDSSAALIPYLANFADPFVLISTGTWCISLNPFNQTRLSESDLKQDCLSYMEYRGKPIKASRVFAGNEHEQQTKKLAAHFQVNDNYYKEIAFNPDIQVEAAKAPADTEKMLPESFFGNRDLESFSSYHEAYHQLIADLVTQQLSSTALVLAGCEVKRIFVDGGFGKNEIYMQMLANAMPNMEVYAASVAQASAIGAALAVHRYWNPKPIPENLIELKYYSTRSNAAQTIKI